MQRRSQPMSPLICAAVTGSSWVIGDAGTLAPQTWNQATGRWSVGAPLPETLTELRTAELEDGRILAAGWAPAAGRTRAYVTDAQLRGWSRFVDGLPDLKNPRLQPGRVPCCLRGRGSGVTPPGQRAGRWSHPPLRRRGSFRDEMIVHAIREGPGENPSTQQSRSQVRVDERGRMAVDVGAPSQIFRRDREVGQCSPGSTATGIRTSRLRFPAPRFPQYPRLKTRGTPKLRR